MKASGPIDDRLPVWTALSELFVDTELSLADIVRVADLLAASPYSIAELERVLVDEVLQAFAPNLVSPVGEWTGWSDGEVGAIMAKARSRGFLGKRLADFTALPVKKAVLGEWNRVLPLLERSRAQAAQTGSVRHDGFDRAAGNSGEAESGRGDGAQARSDLIVD